MVHCKRDAERLVSELAPASLIKRLGDRRKRDRDGGRVPTSLGRGANAADLSDCRPSRRYAVLPNRSLSA
jgi:hypothetical protein